MVKKATLTAILLFGIFFGAGNLIFPPALGLKAGEQLWPAIMGFIVSGVGLAVATLIVGTLNPNGYQAELTQKSNPTVSAAFLVLLYLTIGPFFAIPRTATTSFEIAIRPLVENHQRVLLVYTVIYFGCALLIALKPSQLLTTIGKVMTPLFAMMILVLVVVGAVQFGGQAPHMASPEFQERALFNGFVEGYNTLDALAAVAFCVIALQTLKNFGFSSKKEYLSTVGLVGVFTAILFSVLYVGLAFLGSRFPIPESVLADSSIHHGAYILTAASESLFGAFGQWFLAIMVILTCFTTTVGLIVATANFFVTLWPKMTYRTYTLLFAVIGFVIANAGLNTVIQFSLPILLFLYPLVMIMVLLVVVNKAVPLSHNGMFLTFGIVAIVGVIAALADGVKISAFQQIHALIPFSQVNLAWVVPAMVGLILAVVLPDKQKGTPFSLK